MEVILRPMTGDDKPFLFNLFKTSRPDLDLIELDEEMKNMLIHQQYNVHEQMFVQYPKAEFNIVLLGDKKVGRFYVHREENSIEIMSIAMLPDYRNMGIGSALISKVLNEAAVSKCNVSLKVAWFNSAAKALYERLGFEVIEDVGVYSDMLWIYR